MSEEALDLLVERITAEILDRISFEVEASGRHVHLCRDHIDALFGKGHSLTSSRGLSQPAEFLSVERLTLVGPKGTIENVAILGPERKRTQVELSITDAKSLGVKPPVRDSGDTGGSASLILKTATGEVTLDEGVIVAHRHVHMTPEDAERFGVSDGDRVSVRVAGDRPAVFEGVLVRVSPRYRLAMHIDYDEANACGWSAGVRGRIVGPSDG
ncbi:MAG: phosphate propanoyltransferase [Synergistota bacterium]|jgi:propanediol utilization protein|nr:phosphate propanoyltransferase [Synergistota bacterium]OPZ41154.1 MAG: Phosphate propanoyltransferase [Synergistetes bacterium ADurb.BinA166]